MTPETQQNESPYCIKIETATGQSATVPIAFLTPKQVEAFRQSEFKSWRKKQALRALVFMWNER